MRRKCDKDVNSCDRNATGTQDVRCRLDPGRKRYSGTRVQEARCPAEYRQRAVTVPIASLNSPVLALDLPLLRSGMPSAFRRNGAAVPLRGNEKPVLSLLNPSYLRILDLAVGYWIFVLPLFSMLAHPVCFEQRLVIGNGTMQLERKASAVSSELFWPTAFSLEDYARGRVKKNVVPFPGVLSTRIFPLWFSTMLRAMASPSPLP